MIIHSFMSRFIFSGIQKVTNYRALSDNSVVVNAIIKSLISPSPSDRYMVGLDARYMLIPLGSLPAFIADFIFRVLFRPPQARAG